MLKQKPKEAKSISQSRTQKKPKPTVEAKRGQKHKPKQKPKEAKSINQSRSQKKPKA